MSDKYSPLHPPTKLEMDLPQKQENNISFHIFPDVKVMVIPNKPSNLKGSHDLSGRWPCLATPGVKQLQGLEIYGIGFWLGTEMLPQ